MNTYKIYWLDGSTEIVVGYDIADACNKAGINDNDLAVIDYYEEISQG